MLGSGTVSGSDLKTDTNGLQDEFFDQQAVSYDVTWAVNDKLSLKYIFGYTDYFYDRTTDTDLTSNAIFDRQFYVSQETEYVSHELQFFYDPMDNLSITSGLFYYDAKISQRGDFYDSTCDRNKAALGGCASRYANDFPYTPILGFDFAAVFPKMDLFTARRFGSRAKDGAALPGYCLPGTAIGAADQLDIYCFGSWKGDVGDRIMHGPETAATDLEYQTRTERYAFAAYTQGVYTLNDRWAVTLGVRWARDQLDGEENLFYYNESEIIPLGFDPAGGTSSLSAVNQLLGWQGGALCGLVQANPACADAVDGDILNPQRMLVAGLPSSSSLWRELERKDDDITWRVNLDFTPTEDDLIYMSATKGFRAGGFNLVFFSSNGKYTPESLVAYELGYKGSKLDNRLQVNSALYYYDYEDVHTFANGPSFSGGYSTSVFAVPTAVMIGFDTDATWIATDNIMVGANISYTYTEYTDDFYVIEPNDPARPGSLFDAGSTQINIDGNQMLRVPEMKGGGYAQYTWPMSAGRVELLANYSWISRVYFSVFENNDQSAPSYDRLDLRASWISNEEDWIVAAFVNNVFDDIGYRQIDQYGATEEVNYRRSGAVTDPRLYGVEVRYKFGAFR
jgi:outer membrane receptor protein involved in Fe transport